MTPRQFWAVLVMCAGPACAQNADLSGLILDPLSAGIPEAELSLRNEETGSRRTTKSNSSGLYSFASLKPGEYRLSVRAAGFETMIQDGIVLEVGATVRIDITLRIGDVRTEVTVHASTPLINTENASVGTVIDRELIEKMPLNGRGVQTLIGLSAGTVIVPVENSLGGQFSVNGQRNTANYFTVDGVSANFAISQSLLGASTTAVQSGAGMTPANNFVGTFSNLVAPEALQEFKIQTSTFAPQFGRAPGGQIELVTRSGTNHYTGAIFEYFRNDKADANNWFANREGSPKPPLRFNNFGGVFGGPVRIPHLYDGRNRTFFFASYDGLRVSQPEPPFSVLVPTLELRQSMPLLAQELLNAYPLPNRLAPSSAPSGFAEFTGLSPLLQRQDAFSVRVDHSFGPRWTSFARYSGAPSLRHWSNAQSLTVMNRYSLATDTLTFGLAFSPSSTIVNDFRFNASRQLAQTSFEANPALGGRVPSDPLLFPSGYSSNDSFVLFRVGPAPFVAFGSVDDVRTRQLQALDQFTVRLGAHQLAFGADYRWFSPVSTAYRAQGQLNLSLYRTPPDLLCELIFPGRCKGLGLVDDAVSGATFFLTGNPTTAYIYETFSAHAQDTWKAGRKLTLTYGVRWEVAPGPRVSVGRAGVASGLRNGPITPTPEGRSSYPTTWSNFAPRLGIAWQALNRGKQRTVVRVGAGKFFDLGHGGLQGQPYRAVSTLLIADAPLGALDQGVRVDLSLLDPNIPAVSPFESVGRFSVVSPSYKLPYTWQWNTTVEQVFGQQSVSVGYIGAMGSRLSAWTGYFPASGGSRSYWDNGSSSSYHSLQLQFNRRLSSLLHALMSYTWAHSIDNISTDYTVPFVGSTSTSFDLRRKGSSNFDVRHALNGSIIASLPAPRGTVLNTLLRSWTANTIFFARTAIPTDLFANGFGLRPDVVPNQPLYLYGPQFPGGKSYNMAAFTPPPAGRDGNFGRNVLRGLGAWQIDFALHRTFRITERARVQFRAEAFNVFNHPNFANPSLDATPSILTLNQSGAATRMLADGLSPTNALGSLSPLFQIGAPRSLQFALCFAF